MRTKFKKGDKVILSDKLESNAVTVVSVILKPKEKKTTAKKIINSVSCMYEHYMGSLYSTPIFLSNDDKIKYALSNDKIVGESKLTEYNEGVHKLAKELKELKKSISSFGKRVGEDEDEDY